MRRRLFHVAIAAMILFTTLPATGAVGGSGQAPETTALETVLTDVLGLSPDQAQMFAESINEVGDDYDDFGWGGDASVPATLTGEDVPWAIPTGVGLNFVSWQDSDLPDFDTPMDGMVMGTTDGGIQQGQTYAVATAVMGDDIPLSSSISGIRGLPTLHKQFDFALRVATLFAWAGFPTSFPDDTWIAASFILSLTYGPNPWALAYYMFSEDGQTINPVTFPGFFLIYGNLIIVAVLASALGDYGAADIGIRFAGDVKNAPVNPSESIVLRAPAGSPTSSTFFGAYGHRTVPSLDGRFDPYHGYALRGPNDSLWVYGQPRNPWGTLPPRDVFSGYFQVGYFGDSTNGSSDFGYVGWQTHKGVEEFFTSGPEGPLDGGMGFIQTNGSLLFETPWKVGDVPWTVFIDGGTLPTEDGQFKWNQIAITVDPETIETVDDPQTYHETQSQYDLTTGKELVVVTTTTTQPASTSESTQPATTTETTQPATTTTTPTSSTTERGSGESCLWCWGIVLLFLAVLLSILWIWLKTYEWWTCWLPWAIVIFAWIPFILAGIWWWRPTWWWVPLLAWFPLVAGYWWYWARHRSWWQPWHVYVVGGYLVALAAGMFLVGAPEWGLLFPLFWAPWVGFYLWFRGIRQPWWQPWMWLFFGGYVAWVFIWVIALTPWWAWWLPVVFSTVTFWWFTTHGYAWGQLRSPKWCWITPFAMLPFLAWWIPLWGPWWCFVIALVATMSLVCAIVNHVWEKEWWTCWMLWIFLIWVGIPLLLAGLWFFQPNWWWLPLLGWFLVIPHMAWWWGRHRSWWQPWYMYVVGGYLGVAAVLMYIVGSPTWGLLFPVFWLAPAAFYLWYRPRRQPWFQPWMWGLFGAYIAAVFIWVIWLTPFWGWWFPVFFLSFFGWWGMRHGYERDVWIEKSVALIPLGLLPWASYMVAIYCIPEYYWF